jgi:hypothetical protein
VGRQPNEDVQAIVGVMAIFGLLTRSSEGLCPYHGSENAKQLRQEAMEEDMNTIAQDKR